MVVRPINPEPTEAVAARPSHLRRESEKSFESVIGIPGGEVHFSRSSLSSLLFFEMAVEQLEICEPDAEAHGLCLCDFAH